jgi:hypothetical protein
LNQLLSQDTVKLSCQALPCDGIDIPFGEACASHRIFDKRGYPVNVVTRDPANKSRRFRYTFRIASGRTNQQYGSAQTDCLI